MKIVIAEDHLMIRDALRRACANEFGAKIVAETDSGADAIAAVARLRPHILLLDLRLKDLDGFAVATRVRADAPATRILIVSSHVTDFTVYRLEELGVHGFVDKSTALIEAIRDALTAVAAGRTYFSPSFLAARRAYHNNPRCFAKVLSPTEQEVLALIGRGQDDVEIAGQLDITPRTAQTHRSNILRKLRIKGTPKLIHFAVETGFVLETAGRP